MFLGHGVVQGLGELSLEQRGDHVDAGQADVGRRQVVDSHERLVLIACRRQPVEVAGTVGLDQRSLGDDAIGEAQDTFRPGRAGQLDTDSPQKQPLHTVTTLPQSVQLQ